MCLRMFSRLVHHKHLLCGGMNTKRNGHGVTLEAQLQLRGKLWLGHEFNDGIID